MSPGTRRRVAQVLCSAMDREIAMECADVFLRGARSALYASKQLSDAKRSRGWHGVLKEMVSQLTRSDDGGVFYDFALRAVNLEIRKEIKRLAERDGLC